MCVWPTRVSWCHITCCLEGVNEPESVLKAPRLGCLPTGGEATLNWCIGVGLHSDSDFLDIIAQPLTFTNAAFADRLYQGACDACNIYILLSGHRNIALLAEVSADYFCSAQSQAMDPVAEAAICTSLLPQKARA